MAHLGEWWDRMGRKKFPSCQEQPPLGQVVETFGPTSFPPASFDFGMVPAPRVWFVSETGEQVVQVQRDRFLCNWRKPNAEAVYPRYESVGEVFFKQLEAFQDFVRASVKQEMSFTQFELTYINHVEGSNDRNVFPDFAWHSKTFLPEPSNAEAHYSFDLPGKATRLHVNFNTGRRTTDGATVLIVDFTARGFGPELRNWFDSAHEIVVRGFDELSSASAHELWGKGG